MVQRKRVDKSKRLVWRVTANSPLGEFVDPDEPSLPAETRERTDRSFLVSTFELAHGLEVTDETDTIPGDLFDELFKKT